MRPLSKKIINYDSFQFEILKVQEVWTGSAIFNQAINTYAVNIELKQADFLKFAEGFSRSASEDFTRNDEVFNE